MFARYSHAIMLEGSGSEAAGPEVPREGARCPGCGGRTARVFFDRLRLPVHCNILWSTPDDARRAPTASMRLANCPACGLLFNSAFDPSAVTYDPTYENSLHHSERFKAYAEALAGDLSTRLNLRGRLVVEIGCGKGEFLRRLCSTAGATGLGIDASYDPTIAADGPDDVAVRFVREPFSTLPEDLAPALVFCRHVLEHVPDPLAFVSELAAAAGRAEGCRVLIEVPDVLFTLRDLGIWDLIYEHYSYFSAPSLSRLCERAGLRVERSSSVFGNQFLCVEATVSRATPAPDYASAIGEIGRLSARFGAEFCDKVELWERRLGEIRAVGQRAVLWGAGSKGITFVNTVAGGDAITCLVDLNPRKHGRFVPGTGQPVVPPEALRALQPDVIIAMNPVYLEEIGQLARGMGLSARLESA